MRCNESDPPLARTSSTASHSRSLRWRQTHGHRACGRTRNYDWSGWLCQRISELFHAPSVDCSNFRRHTRSLEPAGSARAPDCSGRWGRSAPFGATGRSSSTQGLPIYRALVSSSSHTPWSPRSTWTARIDTLRSGTAPSLSLFAWKSSCSCTEPPLLYNDTCTVTGMPFPGYWGGSWVCRLCCSHLRHSWWLCSVSSQRQDSWWGCFLGLDCLIRGYLGLQTDSLVVGVQACVGWPWTWGLPNCYGCRRLSCCAGGRGSMGAGTDWLTLCMRSRRFGHSRGFGLDFGSRMEHFGHCVHSCNRSFKCHCWIIR